MHYHPDRNKDPEAPQRFMEVQNAYDLLTDPVLRRQYDQRLQGGFEDLFSELLVNDDPTIDPLTGRRNYKYHRGKPKPPRDMDEPFDNFEQKSAPSFSLDFTVLGRVMLLGFPGMILSAFVSSYLYDHYEHVSSGHYVITVPFLVFNAFVFLDCIWGTTQHYAMLMKVTFFTYSYWQDLSIRATTQSALSLDFRELKGEEWYRDHLYVYEPEVDFKKVQQFLIQKSLLFKIKFKVDGIVEEEPINISLNRYRRWFVIGASLAQCLVLWTIIWWKDLEGMAFLFLFVFQVLYICYFLSTNRLTKKVFWEGIV